MTQAEWITVKNLATVQGISDRAVRKSIAQNKYVTRKVDGTNGAKYEILVNSLPLNIKNIIDFEKGKNNIEKSTEPSLIKNKAEIFPSHAKKIALARYDLVKLWREYIDESSSKTEAGKEFLALYNQQKLYSVIFKTLGTVSIGTIYRWSKSLKKKDDYKVLVPDYDYGEREHNANLTKNEELLFMNLLLDPSQKSIGKATKLTKFLLNKKGLESPTSERNFRRFADNYKRKHYDRWILMREGQKALKDKVLTFINRDISKLNVGDILVADGHRIAVMTINPFTGRPSRATLVGYLDWKSTALVGYEIMLEENT